jgi:peptidoglycan hydrolase-like protein with peptidoglycan-binding domain
MHAMRASLSREPTTLLPGTSNAARPPVRIHAPSVSPSRFDGGSRERWALDVQRTAGNQATGELARAAVQREGDEESAPDANRPPDPTVTITSGGGARRRLDANPYQAEYDPVTLSNPRFSGNPKLVRIAEGKASLSAADDGPAVKAVQEGLNAIGFEMFRHGADGRFGGETREAVAMFRRRRGMDGDQLTAKALGELDQTAPPPGGQEEHYLDYERLFEDGYLDVTIGVGYDEGGTHVSSLKYARSWLAANGFQPGAREAGKPEQHSLRRHVTYPLKSGDRATREILVRVNVIEPGEGAAAQYGEGLASSDIAVYDGHARRGIGPDFDDPQSARENFIIGVGSALHAAGKAVEPSKLHQSHYVIDRANDLEEMVKAGRFDKEKYRVWFIAACTSAEFFDELRGGILPANMDRSNLDLMGTSHVMPLDAAVPATMAMLDGILKATTIEDMSVAMTVAGEEGIKAIPENEVTPSQRKELLDAMPGLWIHEGVGDNAVAASP